MTRTSNSTAKPDLASSAQGSTQAHVQAPMKIAMNAFPIVGIGASAGGLAAFEAFFSGMPTAADPGMAFVLVQHLAPDHKSMLSELVRRYTRMQVFEVEDGMKVQVNCTYIIPPNRDMAFLNGKLQLLEPAEARGHRMPIDFFFNSLARALHERAFGIVLSGTGADGTLGVRAIKGEGGMTMAQLPASSEFAGMPSSAIGTGLIDYELPPAEMPPKLIAYVTHGLAGAARAAATPEPKDENALNKVFVLLRAHTGHDFSLYKASTVRRRIERRMAVHQVDSIDAYVKFLQQAPAEAEALFRDLLIGVTNFFRDPSAFQALAEQVIPRLFENKNASDSVRVWCTACSTGEEAYSIAILLQERMEALKQSFKLQVFATDIDSRAITTARAGLYATSIAADLTPERLARFFTLEPDGRCYRIQKVIRDMLVFSEQDVLKDPPFSKLDLITCRNLLIYLRAPLQRKLVQLFHYTLNPDGFLFLGTSETVGEFGDLFAPLDHKSKLFQRRQDAHAAQRPAFDRPSQQSLIADQAVTQIDTDIRKRKRPSLREFTEQALLKQMAASCALVDSRGDVLYLHGRTGQYLEPAPGEARVSNILKMAREGLRRPLATALHDAMASKTPVRLAGVRVKTNGHYSRINVSIEPILANVAESTESTLYLVLLEEASAPVSPNLPGSARAPDAAESAGAANASAVERTADDSRDVNFDDSTAAATIASLRDDLRVNREFLHATNEELETANEELKSSNEEMQSINEELQSTNEELETSKEEMQSVNEELATVNSELQIKVADLSRASNDMTNLLACTGIGTLFVDHQLRIQRYTPTATRIINLIPTDIGRPMAHIMSNLVSYDTLIADAQKVLSTLIPLEVEVEAREGTVYTMRIQPYRTSENVIEGAVITFVDINEMVRTRDALRKANELLRLAVVVRDAHDAITVQDLNGRILAWNPGAVRMYGWTEAEALLLNAHDRTPKKLREQARLRSQQLDAKTVLEPCRTHRIAKDGSEIAVWLTSTALVNEGGHMYAIATTERAIDIEQTQAGGECHAKQD